MQTLTLHSESELLEHNVLNAQQLFELYHSLHFIYPAKMEKLNPVFDIVKQNWQKALRLHFPTFWVGTIMPNWHSILSTATAWQYLNKGMIGQHLASSNPVGSRIIFLGILNKIIKSQHSGFLDSYQIYYRPQNKYSSRVFDPLPLKAGKELSEIIPYNYYETPFLKYDGTDDMEILEINHGDDPEFISFVAMQRGRLFIKAQELDTYDINLKRLNNKFKRYGLKRTRRIFVARGKRDKKIYGAIIINQSSPGMNFSFFENSSELILCKHSNPAFLLKAARSLLCRASALCFLSPLRYLPVMTDPEHSAIIEKLNGKLTRNYNLFMMLRRI